MEILLTISYSMLFIFLIQKMKFFDVDGISKKMFSAIFLLKIIAGLAVWAIYTFYYPDRTTADIYKYFDDSKVIFDALKTNPAHYFKMLTGIGNNGAEFNSYYTQMNFWARQHDTSVLNDSHTIIRFNAFVRLFSFEYYNVHTVFMCFLSLIGLTAIYKTFVTHLSDKKNALFFIVFLLPSVLFWSSGVLKEGIIFFSLGLLIYYFNKLFEFKAVFFVGTMAFLLGFSKFYIWLSILPGLVFLFWATKSGQKNATLKFVIVMVTLGILGFNIEKIIPIQSPLVTLSQKQIEFNRLASGEMTDATGKVIPIANSAIQINKLEPTFISFISNAPAAFVNVLFRPFIWEMKSIMILMAGFENMLILFIIVLCLFFIKPIKSIAWIPVLFCLSFVIIQFVVIGETTPIIGAIARYKTPALPFLLISFLLILDAQKICKKFPFLKRTLN
jgi:hypothetical protein